MKLFNSQKINPWVTEIMDITGVRSFLVEGTDRAVLIDTGVGAGNIREYVESLTKLTYDVILTHGHVDHAGGAGCFEKVYLAEEDWSLEKVHCTREMKEGYLEFAAPDFYEEIKTENYISIGKTQFISLENEQEFSLGGITLKTINVPGHTAGMMCILLQELKILLVGDACNDRTFLFDREATSVSAYQKSLKSLQLFDSMYDTVWFSHGPLEQKKGIVEVCIGLTEEILQRIDDKVPFEFMGQTAYMAKSVTEDGVTRADGGRGNIIYSLTKL